MEPPAASWRHGHHTELVVTFDLGIRSPAFVLKQPLEVRAEPWDFTGWHLMESVLGYLEVGVSEELVHAQRKVIEEAIQALSKDDESDRSGLAAPVRS
jgi:hypothetical protein